MTASPASRLSDVAMRRYDTVARVWRDVSGTAEEARRLLDAGAPVEGDPADRETPLITAASYGDASVAQVLVEAGADVDAHASDNSGGVPGGSALLHAAVFGNTSCVDVLVAAGATVSGLVEAAAIGDVSGHDLASYDEPERVRALVMAAAHERIDVIDALVAAGTPVDAVDEVWAGQPLREAAADGRPESVRRLLAHGADPAARDDEGRTALDHCRLGRASYPEGVGYDEVERLLS